MKYLKAKNFNKNSAVNNSVTITPTYIGEFAEEILKPDFGNSIKALFQDPSDFVANCFWFPLPTAPIKKTVIPPLINITYGLKLGRYEFENVRCLKTYTHSKLFNLGNIPIKSALGSYFDPDKYYNYDGYSSCTIYLPFIGWVEISKNAIISQWNDKPFYLLFRLAVDYKSGQACYYIFTCHDMPMAGEGENEHFVSYKDLFANDEDLDLHYVASFTFQLGVPFSVSSTNVTQMYRNIVSAGVNTALAAGKLAIGASLPTSFYSWTNESTNTFERGRRVTNINTRSIAGAKRGEPFYNTGKQISEPYTDTAHRSYKSDGAYGKRMAVAGGISETINSSLSAFNNLNYDGSVERVNSCNLFDGLTKNIVIVLKTPKINSENSYSSYKDNAKIFGLPYGKFDYLYTVHGLTFISDIHLEDMGDSVTIEELIEIEGALKSGVILP